MKNLYLKFGIFVRIIFVHFIILNSSSHSLFANFQDFLKPALNKSSENSMQGIDFIYIINLDERPEKFENCVKQLKNFGITPYRFSAVNGWDIPLDKVSSVGIRFEPWMNPGIKGTYYKLKDKGEPTHAQVMVPGKTYLAFHMSRGAIGIVLSHLSVLKDALDAGYETIWVMEDDIDVIQNPHSISHYIQELDRLVGKDGWDILFTDPDTKNKHGNQIICLSFSPRPNFSPENPERFAIRKKINKNFTQIGARYGAYSMIIRRSGIKKLYQFIEKYKVFLPWDMEYTQPNGIKLFSLNFEVVSTLPHALTDNAKPTYKLKKQLK